ncbi:MAG: VCBS repeat-containing protein [Bacteroidota bacterium]|nr:VCBS repeat-containing protein [Bacteroidota bacterium]
MKKRFNAGKIVCGGATMGPLPECSAKVQDGVRFREGLHLLLLTALKRSTVAGFFFLALLRDAGAFSMPLPKATSDGTFAAVSFADIPVENAVGETPMFSLAAKSSASLHPDIIYFDEARSSLVALSTNGDGTFSRQRMIGRASEVSYLAAGDLNHDGIDDIIAVHRETNEIQVFISSAADSSFTSATYKVNFYPERALIADIDDDGNPDIMVYGKLSSGISVLRGNGSGGFTDAQTIFADIPVADAAVVKLNDDEFPDLVIHNWLTNEYLFFFGMGDLQFSQQNVLSFGHDSVSVFFGDFNGDDISDFGVAFPQRHVLELFRGDGMVNFEHYQTLGFSGSPDTFFLFPIESTAVNDPKGSPDIVAGDQRNGMFSVFVNSGDGIFKDGIVFGCPADYAAILPGDFDGDGWNDLAVVERGRKRVDFYWNARRLPARSYMQADKIPAGSATDELSFAVGKMPSGITVGDFDHDGRDDLAVVNELSSTLSILYSTGRSNFFHSQSSFSTVESPSSVRLYAKSDSSLTFLLGHEEAAKVSVLTIGQESPSYTYSIPTANHPRVFLPDASLQEKGIEFYVYSGARQNSLSYFRQVSGTRFIERSFKPIIPSRLLAAAVNDYNDDGKPDLAYVYYETESGKYNLGITFSDSAGEYKGKTLSYVFPDSVMKRCYLLFDDMNGDGIQDCLLYSAPSNSIRIALGKGGGRFGDFSPVINDIVVTQPDQIQIIDFDRDGINDIAVQNGKTSELLFLKGKGNGRFYPPAFLLDLPRHSVFRFGDFNGDGMYDIA